MTDQHEATRSVLPAAPDAEALLEHISEIVCVVSADGLLTYISPSVRTMLGWEPSEVLGRPLTEFLDSERHPDYDEVLDTVAELQGTHGPFGLNLLRVDGTIRLLETTVTNRLADPAIRGLVAVARDETERMAAAELQRKAESRFRALVRNSSDIVVVIDSNGRIRYASPSVERILGITVLGPDASNVLHYVHPDDLEAAKQLLRLAVQTSGEVTTRPFEIRLRAGDGSWRDLELLGTNLLDDPDVAGLVFNARDVTDRRRAEELVTEQATILEGITLGMPLDLTIERILAMIERRIPGGCASIASLDPDGVLRHPWARTFPHAVLEAFDQSPMDGALGQAVRQAYPAIFTDIAADPRWVHLREIAVGVGFRSCWCYPMLVPGGLEQIGMLTVMHIDPRDPEPAEVELLERARNLAAIAVERHRFEGQLEHQAVHDVLTGLPNRLLLMDRIRHAVARCLRNGADVAVLFIDLDNFKVINDSLGHGVGDLLLKKVAERFLAAVDPNDTVGRFGGDEFVVVCEEVGGEEGAVRVSERLAQALDEPIHVDGAEVVVSASIGITLADDIEADPQSLIRDADAAMYRAKEQGRAGHAVFEDELHQRVVRRLDLERALRGALADSELDVHYQPVVRLEDDEVVGVEALARWHRPGEGVVPPDRFIEVAEETGMVVQIDRWVLGEALKRLAEWRGSGFGEDLTVSVNLSARHLGDPKLSDVVEAALLDAGLPPSALSVEITESALAADAAAALYSLTSLSQLGVHLAIDDFGTGYASLDYLRRFAMADQLKIDRSFVADLDTGSTRDQAIVSASLLLARDLGFTSVAEGVETETQRQILIDLGCKLGQGFLLCPPLPASDLREWLSKRAEVARP